ncbi:amidohydrolase [Enterovibrio calviensis]|uniref:amidohydrolase n=1 Tax=Enterovibrio calviensis TaxID=91359 RepID=UPI000480F979|nr:amidohydrolase family protein [Enterovibrio calviensis]
MKKVLKVSLLSALIAAVAGCSQYDASSKQASLSTSVLESPVTIFLSDDIITMSPEASDNVTAIAVQNGRILDLGDKTELLKKYQAHPDLTVDKQFQDKVITPGFVEPHIHLWMSGFFLGFDFITPGDWNLPWGEVKGIQGNEAYFERLREIEAGMDEGEPLVTWGYHNYFHGREMSKALLNEVSDTRPIIVWHRSAHELFLNDAALSYLGWEEKDWQFEGPGGDQLDWERGHAFENGMKRILPDLMKFVMETGRFATGMERTRDYVHSGGITTAVDPGVIVTPALYDQMVSILLEDDFPMDYWLMPAGNVTYMMAEGDPEKGKEIAEAQLHQFESVEQIQWMPKFVKLFSDGAMFSQLMQLKGGYLDGHDGEWLQTPEDLEASMRPYWNDDYTIIVHANGDLGFESAVDIVEKLSKDKPREDHRTGFHHLGITDKEDIPRAVATGSNFSVNPYYTHLLAERYSEEGVGKERAEVMARGRSFLDAGGKLSMHSDAPMAPAQPLALVWAAVNRLGLSEEKVMGQEERITVDEAMRAITIDAAYTARLEGDIGSIDIGKYANFTVLDDSPYKVDPKDIRDINVSATVYRGHTAEIEVANAGLKSTENNQTVMKLLSRIPSSNAHLGHNHADGDVCESALVFQQAMNESIR